MFDLQKNNIRRIETIVADCDASKTLANYLCTRFQYHSEELWRDLVTDGHVLVNGTMADAATVLHGGDRLSYFPVNSKEPPVNESIEILYEDDNLIAVNKTGNLPCHPAGRYFANTLWGVLKKRGIDNPIVVNRLDRETSGVVLVAKNSTTAGTLGVQFRDRGVSKTYTVLVEGKFPETLTANGWLVRDMSSVIRKKRAFIEDITQCNANDMAETASTKFVRLDFANGVSRIAAYPETGRTHQIRATLCSLGYPIVGDKIYGVDETIFLRFLDDTMTDSDRARLRLRRQALHAASLTIRHVGVLRTFEAACPF